MKDQSNKQMSRSAVKQQSCRALFLHEMLGYPPTLLCCSPEQQSAPVGANQHIHCSPLMPSSVASFLVHLPDTWPGLSSLRQRTRA